jgi:endonuclease/exonuclease/phosphatase family metal-dependent hydrolase
MNIKKISTILLTICFFVASALLLFILICILTDYKPAKEQIITRQPKAAALNIDTIDILTWNTGYAGLDSSMDFFYDGGSKTRPDKVTVTKNLHAILSYIDSNSADFILLQEVDRASRRSCGIDMLSAIAATKPQYAAFYGINYNILFIPVPIHSPLGKIESGILTLSRYIPQESIRYAYPVKQSWTARLFLLDRCFVMNRYPLKNGRQLILINTHNSAFDDGKQRREEMFMLKEFIETEYQKGNYVIAGGDWNQIPPVDNVGRYQGSTTKYFSPHPIPDDFMTSSWQWISDGNPTNRFLDEPYIKGKTKETLLDFFLISPNVEAIRTERIDQSYQYSDHNPVTGRFVLK